MIICSTIARKRLRLNKSQSLLFVMVIILSTATLCTALSLSENYLQVYFLQAPAITNRPLSALLKSGLKNIYETVGYFFRYMQYKGEFFAWLESSDLFKTPPPEPPPTPDSSILFSPDAVVENFPITIFSAVILVFFVLWISLSVVFSIFKNERTRFFSLMVLSGSKYEHIKKCAVYEARYLCSIGIPLGIIFSILQTLIIRPVAKLTFNSITSDIISEQFPIEIKFSPISVLITLPIVYLTVLHFSKKACKNINLKTLASDTKNIMNVNIGMRVFSAKEKAYKRHGIERYIAIRNFQSNLSKYLKITFITMIYVVLTGVSLVSFNLARTYKSPLGIQPSSEIIGFTYSSELYFCLVSALIVLMSVFCTFNSVISNINANTNEYALMRSVCSSISSIKKTVRIEGYISIILGISFSIISVLAFIGFAENLFGSTSRMNLNESSLTVIIICCEIAIYILSVIASSLLSSRKMSRIDTIGVLKNLSY